jgi:predicted phosphodiesterase
MFTILELSDIHFTDAPDVDTNAELSNAVLDFAAEIRTRFGDVDAIAVCGDVAFSGLKEEYARASNFLRNLEVSLGRPRIFVIPGNHDIHLPSTVSPEQSAARATPRGVRLNSGERDHELSRRLASAEDGHDLLEPLREYLDFASEYKCGFDASRPFWEHEVRLSPRLELRLRGLTSVLLSDARDKEFLLLLGRMQTAAIHRDPGIFNATLCHHSFEWLLDGEDQRNIIDNRCDLHVTGHDHRQQIRRTSAGLHLCAGALQPDRRDPHWKSCLNLISVDIETDGDTAEAIIQAHAASFVPEADRFEWIWGPPNGAVATVNLAPEDLPKAEREAHLARLQRRLANLSSGDRFAAARDSELDLEMLGQLPASETVAAIIADAEQRGATKELWDKVDRLHGKQRSGENPFA